MERVIPDDHLVRKIEAVLDLGWVHRELRPFYSHTWAALDRLCLRGLNGAKDEVAFLRIRRPIGFSLQAGASSLPS